MSELVDKPVQRPPRIDTRADKEYQRPPRPTISGLFSAGLDYQSLIDEIPIGMLVLDRKRRVVGMNRSLEALTGFYQKQVQGLPCAHVMRGKICIRGCPAPKITATSEPVCLESDLINRDRRLIPVRINLAPLADSSGRHIGFLETVEDLRPIRELDATIDQAYSFAHIIGRSPQMEKIFRILPVMAQNDSSLLITGETGTGKDMLAETVHQASGRSKSPFVKINCGALPETLLESELFGHQKGAFTGAVENKPGRFRLAHNGTLYLTEIGDLPLTLQVKMLTFLDDQVVYPLGSAQSFQANVRIIAATHHNLEQMVAEGRFRQDLLFRLNVVRMHLPPLREREDDIRLLLDHFANTFADRFGKKIDGFADDALHLLLAFRYPGNVRELRNIVEYAVNMCPGGRIQPGHLPAYLTESHTQSGLPPHISPTTVLPSVAVVSANPAASGPGEAATPAIVSVKPDSSWPSVERQLIIEALIKAGGRRGKAAEILGWGRSTLWRKIKGHGIDRAPSI